MLSPEVYWVPAPQHVRLAVMPRPRGEDCLQEEVSGWHRIGLDYVVSLLESHEVRELGLTEEAVICRSVGLEFLWFPVRDHGVPRSIRETSFLVEKLGAEVASGTAVGIHCRAGIGRSALIAGCVLLKLGVPENEVFPLISRARGVSVPNPTAQVKWLAAYKRAALRR
jgi:protein-tyrosine phosphatase